MVLLELLDAGHFLADGPRRDQAQKPGDVNGVVRPLLLVVGKSERGERRRRGLGLPLGLDRGELDLLRLAGGVAGFVAEHDHRQRGRQSEARGHGKGAQREAHIARPQQVVRRYAQHEQARGDIARCDGVHEFGLRHRVEEHRVEAHQLHAHGFKIEFGADRILHPAIGDQNPERRQIGAERHEESHQQMLNPGEAIPAEKKQSHESGLEDERHQTFDRERHAEHVADVMRVVRPVGPELEFERDAGGHAHHEVDAEQQAPEAGHVAIDLAPGHHVHRFHDDQHPRQAQGERHEQEVIHRGDGELQPRDVDELKVDHGCSLSVAVPTQTRRSRSRPVRHRADFLEDGKTRGSRSSPAPRTSPQA